MSEGQEREEILDKIKAVLDECLGPPKEEVLLTSRFVEDLQADSLDLTEMVMVLEEECRVVINDKAAEQLKTVQQTVDLIFELRREERPPSPLVQVVEMPDLGDNYGDAPSSAV